MSWVRRKTAFGCDTQYECGNVRLPSITVASSPSGLQGCHNLGGRSRWQSSTAWWIDPKSSEIYHLANLLGRENADVVGDKPVKNGAGEMSMIKDAKQKAWLEHYQRLLNVEFDWDPDQLSDKPPVEGPPIPITIDMVKKAISQMKIGKAPGPSGIMVKMIWAASDTGASMIRDLTAAIIGDGKVHSNWEQSFIVCLYEGKGDALERGNHCGLKLTEQVMKVLERILWTASSEGVNQWFPVWPHPRQRHNRCNLCCQAAAREVSSCQQETTWLL